MIHFNKTYISGRELSFIQEVFENGHLSGNGLFTLKCQEFFQSEYGFKKCFLTTSCTTALEMAAILCRFQPGDEVIIPSYTFVSTANAFILHGATVVFADSNPVNPNIDVNKIEGLITNRTKAIVAMHYGGISCDMKAIMEISDKFNLIVIEDAAESLAGFYNEHALGSIGHFAAFSFHDSKNISCGEGGLFVVNDEKFIKRAEIIWEKGTNRADFLKGIVPKYEWIDIGSSFLMSEILAAVLFAQLQELDEIQEKRINLWSQYFNGLKELEEQGKIKLPFIPSYASNNGHVFYLLCKNKVERDRLIEYLFEKGIQTVFHYLALHESPFYREHNEVPDLKYSNLYTETLIRLPLYFELTNVETDQIIHAIKDFYRD